MTNITTNTTIHKNLDNLKILSINVNSIIANQRRASLYQAIKKHNPDIVFISETKLNSSHVITFKDYNIVRNDRKNKEGGGTAIIIRKNIPYKKIDLSNTTTNQLLEHTILKIKIKSNSYLYLIAAYATCGSQKEFIPDLNNLFNQLKLDNENNFFILAGDLNAKHTSWLNQNNNPRGISLAR